MSRPEPARLALQLHFLFEAQRLALLSARLSRATEVLARAVEEGQANLSRPFSAIERAVAEEGDQVGLEALSWPAAADSAVHAAARALARCRGPATQCRAAERLGRFCEQLVAEAEGARTGGSYYTPLWLARRAVDLALDAVLAGRRGGPKAALSLRVLDPAAGAGAFVLAAVLAIADATGARTAATLAAAVRCVHAVERHPLAAEACRLAVLLGASMSGRALTLPPESVQVGDALSLTWPMERSFDVVAGNPPWGVKLEPARAAGLARLAPEALEGHRDSFLFFLLLAAAQAREDGALAFVLPDAVLFQVRYQAARRHLLRRFRPLWVARLGERVFPATTAPAALLCLGARALPDRELHIADARCCRRSDLAAVLAHSSYQVPQPEVEATPQLSFVPPPQWLRMLFQRLCDTLPSLGDLDDVELHDVGINYPTAETGRTILYRGPREDPRDMPVTRGRDFVAFGPIGRSLWLRHDWRARLAAKRQAGVREHVYRLAPKLLFRQTGERPIATIDREGVWFGRSVIAVTARDAEKPSHARQSEGCFTLLWLCAVLNSRPFAALYCAVAPETGRAFAQVKVSKLKLLPVPTLGREELARLAEELLEERHEARRSVLFAELDAVAARAYGLNDHELARVAELIPPLTAAGRRARPAPPGATS